ncbi:ATPase [Catellatospora sp. TT07R-123]|uniref:ATP-binding protein n=1 Tax=Catellatospora sp. TT07R-123 TaxID=2733863 RepID=UPI001AFF0726|nr:ATP-binding protein [Catellatospora sp. TT07R-123]GHJ45260.1 ATPase [Catellatospora sp. TT07R-123]
MSLLGERLRAVEAAVRSAVAARRAVDPQPDDAFRGLYLSDEQAEAVLADRRPPVGPVTAAPGAGSARADGDRLARLAERFGLDDPDVTLLAIALAPDLDPRFERLYGYLNDDVSRRRACVGLALDLAGLSARSAADRHRLAEPGPLVRGGLVVVEDTERPVLGRGLRVPDRVCLHLLGGDAPDPALRPLLADPVPALAAPALPGGPALSYLRDQVSGCAMAAATAARPDAVVLDLSRLPADADPAAVAAAAGREALLRAVALIAGPVEALAERGAGAVRVFADLDAPVLLTGSCPWEPAWSRRIPAVTEIAAPTGPERAALWQRELGEPAAPELAALTAPYRFSPGQIAQAAQAARQAAALDGGVVTEPLLRRAARDRTVSGLERLARRVTPGVGWADLVLPGPVLTLLRELVARVRHRDTVLGAWAMRPGGGRGIGVTSLFAGDSGTGKTMSAEVVAGALGLDMYVVDLSTVVDKYVGETEKNLDRIFAQAENCSSVLLFDEADALFGKRSEVSDAHDRYANVETAFLLQRMESFDGVAVLTTNLRANLDDAFLRRLDVLVDFPKPDAAARQRLWQACLHPHLPQDEDLELEFLADSFDLSGGNIRSIAVTAAYLSAEAGRPLSMTDLVTAVHREYRKLGRLATAAEFGPWFGAWAV